MTKRIAGLTPIALASVAVAIVTIVFFFLSIGDWAAVLDPSQLKTAHLAFGFMGVWAVGWIILEVWTLLDKSHDKDHISPTITTLLKESWKFRVSFVGFVAFALSLLIHFAGLTKW